eukprot:CAMPEP_0185762278 /NCGR_PEP_ID=MMETSP1174-20130828/21264_1 /TAXON_ID=35687 /ORGANISM="Dictyocha speculum, Strain CCMP1381" /LENGTH=51 /DNA_ID=CAMNT_0028443891 /DNA_START=41 /DNA_END=192 /DNA_ORIENTATION=-
MSRGAEVRLGRMEKRLDGVASGLARIIDIQSSSQAALLDQVAYFESVLEQR